MPSVVSLSCPRFNWEDLTRVVTFFHVTFFCKSSQSNDWSRVTHLPDQTRTLKAIQIRHLHILASNTIARIRLTYLDVHENQVEVFTLVHAFLHDVVCLLAVFCDNDFDIIDVLELEHANNDLLIDKIVLNRVSICLFKT